MRIRTNGKFAYREEFVDNVAGLLGENTRVGAVLLTHVHIDHSDGLPVLEARDLLATEVTVNERPTKSSPDSTMLSGMQMPHRSLLRAR